MKSSPLLIAQDLKEPLPEENLAEKLSTAENDFETNKTIYESLTTNLCKEQYTTIGWIESLMSYNAVGMTAVVPGGALCSVDKFGMNSEAVLNAPATSNPGPDPHIPALLTVPTHTPTSPYLYTPTPNRIYSPPPEQSPRISQH